MIQIFFSTYSACSLSGVKYGTGRHTNNILPQDIPKALYFWWLCELFYTVTTVFIRLSIAVFLLRICVKTTHKVIIYATLAGVLAFSTFYFFLVLFQCSPVSFFWGQYEGMKGTCINPAAVPDASIAHSVVSFTADWILGLLPIVLIWDIQMNRRTKISIAAILSLGLLYAPSPFSSLYTLLTTDKCGNSNNDSYSIYPCPCPDRRLPLRNNRRRNLVYNRARTRHNSSSRSNATPTLPFILCSHHSALAAIVAACQSYWLRTAARRFETFHPTHQVHQFDFG